MSLAGSVRSLVIPFIAMGLCAALTNQAKASCGDYLHQPDESKAPHRAHSESTPQPPMNAPVRCHGPGCRQAPPSPLTTAPVETRLRVETSAAEFFAQANFRDASPRFAPHIESAFAHAGHPLTVDRPPQSVR